MVAAPRRRRRTASGASGCTESTTSADATASPSMLAPASTYSSSATSACRPASGSTDDLVAEPGQLADQLGHHRDPGLALPGLLGHRDLHSPDPRPDGHGACGVSEECVDCLVAGRPRGPWPRNDSTSVDRVRGPRRAGVAVEQPDPARDLGRATEPGDGDVRPEPPAADLDPGLGRGRPGAGRQPVELGAAVVVELEAGPQHPRVDRPRERAAAGDPGLERDVRFAAARVSRSTRSSTRRSGTAARKASVTCICSVVAQRKSAAPRRTSRNSSRCSTASSGGWTATNIRLMCYFWPVSASDPPSPIIISPPVACIRASRRGRAAEPVARRPGGVRVAAVGHQRDGHEDQAQREQLTADPAGRVVDELRQHRGQEDDRLGVAHPDHEAVPDDPQGAARRGRRRRPRPRRGGGTPGRRDRSRYAAPTTFTTVKTTTDSATSAPTPSATATTIGSRPRVLPTTLHSPARRPSESERPMTNSTVGPGIRVSRTDARANVSSCSRLSMSAGSQTWVPTSDPIP